MRLFGLSAKLLFFCLSASAVAETHFCIGGELDQMSSTQVAACQTKMTEIRNAVKRHGAPAGWHFVVVCDESGWLDYASLAGGERARTVKASYATDAQMHWTFVRGSRMDTDEPAEAEMILAAALKSVPGTHAAPTPLANPQRIVAQPALQVADVMMPAAVDTAAGQ